MTDMIEVFTQSSIRITDGDRIIYLDPFQIQEEPHNADFILITHDHYDHFSQEDIGKVLKKDTIIVATEKLRNKAQELVPDEGKLITVLPGERKEINGLLIETVPAYNIIKSFHPKASGWVGYLIHVGNQIVYDAGDTDLVQEIKNISCNVAMVPIGGTYTMDAKQAAELVNTIRPDVAIPIHYGSIVGKKEDADIFAENVNPSIKVEIGGKIVG